MRDMKIPKSGCIAVHATGMRLIALVCVATLLMPNAAHGLAQAPGPASCADTPATPAHLSSADIAPPTSPAMLLENIKLAAQSRWFERDDFYDEGILKSFFGVAEIKRTVLSTPGFKGTQQPPSTIEDLRAHGKMALRATTQGSPQTFEYNLILGRALSGELPNHFSRQLWLYVVSYDESRRQRIAGNYALSYADAEAVFGRGVRMRPISGSAPTDGAPPARIYLFYQCQRPGGTTSITGKLGPGGSMSTLEFSVTSH